MKKENLRLSSKNIFMTLEKLLFKHQRNLFVFSAILLSIFCITSVSKAQETLLDSEPPPLKVISKDEKKQLENETKVKKRTILALELMDSRLLKAEEASSKKEFKEMFNQLGRFHAIIDHTLKFLNRNDKDSRKVLYNFKRFEIGLRKLMPRIELIRRDAPQRYQFYVKSLMKDVREARSRAVEPLFDDTVISEDEGS